MGNKLSRAFEHLSDQFYAGSDINLPFQLDFRECQGKITYKRRFSVLLFSYLRFHYIIFRFCNRLGTAKFLKGSLWQNETTFELFVVKFFIKPNNSWNCAALIKEIKSKCASLLAILYLKIQQVKIFRTARNYI